MKAFLIFLLLSLFSNTAWSADPPLTLYDEGVKQGVVFKVDCTGAGVTCTKTGTTATVNVAGGGPGGSPGGSSPQLQFNNGSSFDGVSGSGADTNGNIGIGTTGPTQKLQVSGTILATAFSGPLTGNVTGNVTGSSGSTTGNASTATALAANGSNCSGNNFALGVDASGVGECAQPAFSNLSGSATDAQIPNNITIDLATTVTTNANLTGDVTSSGNTTTLGSSFKGWTDGGTNVYTTTTTDNVGIGTTTPSTTLEIVKQGSKSPLMVSATATGDGNYLIIKSDGNVGIGTVNPVSTLTITGSSPEGRFVDTNTAGYSSFRFYNGNTSMGKFESAGPSSADAGLFSVANIANYPMAFATNDTNRLTIAANGNVGIGTATSWASPFEVRSTTNSIFSVKSAANTACNTTCISACIGGFDNGTNGNAILDCTNATADTCLCAGSN